MVAWELASPTFAWYVLDNSINPAVFKHQLTKQTATKERRHWKVQINDILKDNGIMGFD